MANRHIIQNDYVINKPQEYGSPRVGSFKMKKQTVQSFGWQRLASECDENVFLKLSRRETISVDQKITNKQSSVLVIPDIQDISVYSQSAKNVLQSFTLLSKKPKTDY